MLALALSVIKRQRKRRRCLCWRIFELALGVALIVVDREIGNDIFAQLRAVGHFQQFAQLFPLRIVGRSAVKAFEPLRGDAL